MRKLLYIVIVVLASCTQKQPANKPIPASDTTTKSAIKIALPTNKQERAKYHTDKDTVYIHSQSLVQLKYTKEDFNDIVDNFPELTSSNTEYPDTAYNHSTIFVDLVDSTGEKKHLSFGSQAGQDDYYILYAYFLQQKNGIAKYAVRRKKLHEIYNTLNSLFSNLSSGGSYFGHQYSRIEGYAEFSVYWYSHYEDYFDRAYDITKQKAFYIGGLKQLIVDEVQIDSSISNKEKAEMRKLLFDKVDQLNRQITDNFYLRMAQSFQSDHY